MAALADRNVVVSSTCFSDLGRDRVVGCMSHRDEHGALAQRRVFLSLICWKRPVGLLSLLLAAPSLLLSQGLVVLFFLEDVGVV